ncbi:hypothetical protein [Pyxidicoccus trucidator]|uniref:hypothetical protein n=1 Tax=Pyxidicoccus trucidator TaxID=2709662 RepID=UPI0013DA848E|nr:hypothetical protein [Pyxidicoccus trucidator]
MARQARFRWRRALGRGLGVILLLEALLHVALNAGLVQSLIHRDTHATRMSWTAAWAPWPWKVHARGFSVEHRDPRNIWRVEVDALEAELSLSALFRRHVEIQGLRARGVRAGIRPTRPEDTLPPHKEHKPWDVELRDVEAHALRALVWHGVRYRGQGEARGALRLVVGERLALRVDALKLEGGPLEVEGHEVGTLEAAQAAFTMDATREGSERMQLLGGTRGRFQARAAVASLEALRAWLPASEHLSLHGGGGELLADVLVEHGRLLPGSRLEGRGAPAELALGPVRARASWELDGGVEAREGAPARARLRLAFTPVRVEGPEGLLLKLPEVAVSVDAVPRELTPEAPGTRPHWDVVVHLHVARSHPVDLRPLNARTAPTFRLDSGSAFLQADAHLKPGARGNEARLHVDTDLLSARCGETRLQGMASLEVDAGRFSLRGEHLGLDGTHLRLREVSADVPGKDVRKWEGSLSFPQATLSLSSGALEARFTGSFSNALPFVALLTSRGKLPSILSPLFEADGLEVSGHVSWRAAGARVRELRARARNLQLEGQVDVAAGDMRAILLVTVGTKSVGVEVMPGDTQVHLKNGRHWYEARLEPPSR